LALTIPNAGDPFLGTATRLMYRSTDSHGNADAVTGTYIDPSARWSGPGPRPLIAFAVGTHGPRPQVRPVETVRHAAELSPTAGDDVAFAAAKWMASRFTGEPTGSTC
jgi:hypothetical protein